REARRPHGHLCVICAEHYRCAGPDSSGECTPLCGPCLWVELGAQFRMYQSMADAIRRRRSKLERQVGATECRKAQTRRLGRLRASNVVAGFGRVMMKREQTASNYNGNEELSEFSRIDASGEGGSNFRQAGASFGGTPQAAPMSVLSAKSGEVMRDRRRQSERTQQQVAKRVGTSTPYVGHL